MTISLHGSHIGFWGRGWGRSLQLSQNQSLIAPLRGILETQIVHVNKTLISSDLLLRNLRCILYLLNSICFNLTIWEPPSPSQKQSADTKRRTYMLCNKEKQRVHDIKTTILFQKNTTVSALDCFWFGALQIQNLYISK